MKIRSKLKLVCLTTLTGALLTPVLAYSQFIAGTAPDQRPADAPVISAVDKSGDWYTHALTGVERPYPPSLHFLENQGAWFTPFTRPGMTGPYDIRQWHAGQSDQ